MIIICALLPFASYSQNRPDESDDFDVNRRFDITYVRSTKARFLADFQALARHSDARPALMRKLAYIYTFEVPPLTDSSLYWAEQLILHSRQTGDNWHLAEGMIKKGEFLERFKKEYQKSLQVFNAALQINGSQTQKIFIKRCIAVIYGRTDNPDTPSYIEKLVTELKSDAFRHETEIARDCYNLYIALAEFYERANLYHPALSMYHKALDEVLKFNRGIGPTYLYATIAQGYLQAGNFEKTDFYLNKAAHLFDSLKINDMTLKMTRIRYYNKKEDYENAIKLGEEVIKEMKERQFKRYGLVNREINQLLYSARKSTGHFEGSLGHLEEYLLVKDSLDRQKRTREIEEIRKKFDFDFLENENERKLLIKNNEIQKLQLMTTRQDLQRRDLNEKLTSEKYKNEKIITEHQASNLTLLKNYSRAERELRKSLEQELLLNQENKKLYLTGVVLLILLLAGLVLWIRTRYRQNNRYIQMKSEYQERIARIEVMALRAQMNPHFIFNCLNSILLYMDKQENTQASLYLTKFSRLIRSVLENSASELISLEDELTTLKLYLDMEMMRFPGRFSYDIHFHDPLPIETIHIPPMIIQPFVENGIWHGLMHKTGEGHIRISVAYHPAKKETLVIEVTDNGIGRKKAAELKSKSASRHKSFGMKITAERIEILNKLYKKANTVTVTDLGYPLAGTKVTIELPV